MVIFSNGVVSCVVVILLPPFESTVVTPPRISRAPIDFLIIPKIFY